VIEMKARLIVVAFFLLLGGAIISGSANRGTAGAGPDSCQAIVDAYNSASAKLTTVQAVFNNTPEPNEKTKGKWVPKYLPSQFRAEAEKRKPERDRLQNLCNSNQASKDDRKKLDELIVEITELEALAAFQEANENLQEARTELALAEEPYKKLIKDKTTAMTKAAIDHDAEKNWLAKEKEKPGYKNITDKAQKRQKIKDMATHVVSALKPIKASLEPFACFPDVAQYLEELQKKILKMEAFRTSIASDMGEDLSDLSEEVELTDLPAGGINLDSLPLAMRAALAVAACVYPADKAPALYPDQPGFNPSMAPSYLRTYTPGQYYSVSLTEGDKIIEIGIFQHASASAAQSQFAAWRNTEDPQNPAVLVAWSTPDVPAFKKKQGVLDIVMEEAPEDIVVRGSAGIWHFEVSVMTNQMGLSPAKPGASREDTARHYFLKLIENAKLFRLFP
jgi:hypothetical protein